MNRKKKKIRATTQLEVFIHGTDIAFHVYEQLACLCAFQKSAPAIQRTHLLLLGTGPEELTCSSELGRKNSLAP
jgi:hypothetical protein